MGMNTVRMTLWCVLLVAPVFFYVKIIYNLKLLQLKNISE